LGVDSSGATVEQTGLGRSGARVELVTQAIEPNLLGLLV
jgi:hypothetical protein